MSRSKPVINIITRTASRPNYFGACHQSIQSQTYPAELIRFYVTFDDENDLEGDDSYIGGREGIYAAIEVTRKKRLNQSHFPYHEYLNEVVTDHLGGDDKADGWVMILDDDNQLSKPESLGILAHQIEADGNDPDKLYIWKCQQVDRVIPSAMTFKKAPKPGDIHISCFAFHTSQIELFNIDKKKGAEADVVAKMFNQLNCVWIDDILTVAHVSGNGTREDVDEVPTIKLMATDTKQKISLKPIALNLKTAPAMAPPPKIPLQIKANVKSTIVDEEVQAQLSAVEEGDEDDVEMGDEEDEEEIADEEAQDEDLNPDEEEIANEEPAIPPTKSTPAPQPVSVATELTQQLEAEAGNPETTQLLIRLVSLLKSNKRIYILDENNMRKLGKCVFDALSCVDMEDKLVTVLENNLFERKTLELKNKV